ncbi:MAG: aminotransferase class V-fold PLP-dependent enzyme [Clostridia bacterium]|nr:aminotransferase class V-fold PLP-dependent enzyme [Clostridia bacterium]
MNRTIAYLDNAATSNPKPPAVWQAMQHYMTNVCASPGRGGYSLSLDAGRIEYHAREGIQALFHAPSEEQVVFTLNVTHALNCAMRGLLSAGDHVLTSSMEHNSVIRPLRLMQERVGIDVTVVGCDSRGLLDPDDMRKALRPNTKMIILTHASNVAGSILPIEAVSGIAHDANAYFVVDTAQTAGFLDIDFAQLNPDVLAFTGHKSLLGPPGTGGFIVNTKTAERFAPMVAGGTGSKSDDEHQPSFLPDKFEAGTPNTVGIAGLAAGVAFVMETGIKTIRAHEMSLAGQFIDGVKAIPKIRVYGPEDMARRVATVSITMADLDLAEIAYRLDVEYGIMVRSGLHCSPLAHKTIGTFPEGALRFSFGWFNTKADVARAVDALSRLAAA